jgi:hypothetical protein
MTIQINIKFQSSSVAGSFLNGAYLIFTAFIESGVNMLHIGTGTLWNYLFILLLSIALAISHEEKHPLAFAFDVFVYIVGCVLSAICIYYEVASFYYR